MKSGVCFPSYGRDVVWAKTAGVAWSADYPATNLSLLEDLRRVATASVGATTVVGTLPVNQTIDFIALIHHNLPPATAMTITVYSDTGLTTSVFTSSVTIPAAVDGGYPLVRPIRLPASVSARAIKIEFPSTGAEIEVGAIEVGLFWEWTDVDVGREIGIVSNASSAPIGGGVTHVTRQWAPRYVTGSRKFVDVVEVEEKLLDFQRANGLWRTFVWAWDLDDPATWARECMAVTNDSLPAGTRDGYVHGALPFAFREQLR